METIQDSKTSSPERNENLNAWTEGYTQVPNTILKARNLDSDAKVVIALLYNTYTYAFTNHQLDQDGSFYFTNSRFNEHMDISGEQVIRRVIPGLVAKGLIRTSKRTTNGKTRNYYELDFDAINNYDGSAVDPNVEADKSERGKVARNGRVKREHSIMMFYGSALYSIIQSSLQMEERTAQFVQLVKRIANNEGYKPTTAKAIVKKMLRDYDIAKKQPSLKPSWLISAEEYANGSDVEDLFWYQNR